MADEEDDDNARAREIIERHKQREAEGLRRLLTHTAADVTVDATGIGDSVRRTVEGFFHRRAGE